MLSSGFPFPLLQAQFFFRSEVQARQWTVCLLTSTPVPLFRKEPVIPPSSPSALKAHADFPCSPVSWGLPVNTALENDCVRGNSVKKKNRGKPK